MTRFAAALLDSASAIGNDPVEVERRAALARQIATAGRVLLCCFGIAAYLSVAAAPPLNSFGF